MIIQRMLLDKFNTVGIDNITLGEKIASSGKSCLWENRSTPNVNVIVIHYISAVEIDSSQPYKLDKILNIFVEYGVSSHYLITRRGKILMLVPEEKKAWHCGGSIMPEPDNRKSVNEFSIGIELVATTLSGFTASQYDSLTNLCLDIQSRNGGEFSYVGHEQIAGARAVALGLRTSEKVDPGPGFNWEHFYALLKKKRVLECGKLQNER